MVDFLTHPRGCIGIVQMRVKFPTCNAVLPRSILDIGITIDGFITLNEKDTISMNLGRHAKDSCLASLSDKEMNSNV